MKSVVLVGCGNIGFRHLQALTRMSIPATIFIVEPNAAGHGRILDHISSISPGTHTCQIMASLADPSLPTAIDLAVIATDTRQRRAAWDELRSVTHLGAVIFEKVLFPTLRDIDEVARDLEGGEGGQAIAGFVNCGRRGFADYQALAQRFGGEGTPVDVTIEGANFGLGSNAIHFLDLAELLNGADLLDLSSAGLDAGSRPSKRPGYVEIFGTLRGRLSNGATVSIQCANSVTIAIRITLAGRDGSRIVIDEIAATIAEGEEVVPLHVRHVSGMSEFYEDALTSGTSALPSYAASARQHRLYLRALRDHLGLSNAADDPCPVS